MVEATGLLWTARRAAGRAMQRLPLDPNWDSTGMRMELVR
jgi:predicted RNase H-like nuclease